MIKRAASPARWPSIRSCCSSTSRPPASTRSAPAAFDELIRDLADSLDLTVFMITHDLDSLYTITDQVAVLADKKVVAMAPVRELEHFDHPWIREYFGGLRGRTAAQV